ncbi:hypothetical protein [Helicobacter cetorum]|uniref:hypothetical protein n=1 Tax=Helicobacter cetorum TaxID=138563 RepID=UPI000CF0F6B4|nr:hypothetical protein [Helicobacter cetorum]
MGFLVGFNLFKALAPYVVIASLGLYILHLKEKLAQVKERLNYTQEHVIMQNESIEKLELQSQEYQSLKPLNNTKIKERYQKIILKDNSCEEKLQSYESLLNAFKNP